MSHYYLNRVIKENTLIKNISADSIVENPETSSLVLEASLSSNVWYTYCQPRVLLGSTSSMLLVGWFYQKYQVEIHSWSSTGREDPTKTTLITGVTGQWINYTCGLHFVVIACGSINKSIQIPIKHQWCIKQQKVEKIIKLKTGSLWRSINLVSRKPNWSWKNRY